MNRSCVGCEVSEHINVRQQRIDAARDKFDKFAIHTLEHNLVVAGMVNDITKGDATINSHSMFSTMEAVERNRFLLDEAYTKIDEAEQNLHDIMKLAGGTACAGVALVPKNTIMGKVFGQEVKKCQHPKKGLLMHYFGLNPPITQL